MVLVVPAEEPRRRRADVENIPFALPRFGEIDWER